MLVNQMQGAVGFLDQGFSYGKAPFALPYPWSIGVVLTPATFPAFIVELCYEIEALYICKCEFSPWRKGSTE